MRRPALPALLLLTAVFTASLTSCSVGISGPTEKGDASSSTAEAPTQSEPEETTNDTPEATPDESAAEPVDDTGAAERDALHSSATTTLTCDGELTLEQTGAIVVIEGDCEHLIVAMNGGALVAGDVDVLEVSGTGTVVYTDALTMLTVTGSANVVHWIGAAPEVSDNGTGNVLAAG